MYLFIKLCIVNQQVNVKIDLLFYYYNYYIFIYYTIMINYKEIYKQNKEKYLKLKYKKQLGGGCNEPSDIILKKFVWTKVPDDNNCLFHALCKILQLSDSQDILRKNITQYMRINKNQLEMLELVKGILQGKTFDEYVDIMALNGTWGGAFEIYVAAKLYDTKIIIIHENGLEDVSFNQIIDEEKICQNKPPVYLYYCSSAEGCEKTH